MKRKFSGLITISIIALSAAAAGIYYHYNFWQSAEPALRSRVPSLAPIWVPDQTTVKTISRLERHLGRLVYPPAAEATSVDLLLFGHQSEAGLFVSRNRRARKPPVSMNYRLSFALVSKKRNFCVVNGSFYGEGARLPDGGRILIIEPNRILIRKKRFKQWIYTADAAEKDENPATQYQKKNNPS